MSDIGLTVRPADLGRSAPPRWAWQHRVVLGYLNLLLGNEGVGKGTLVAWLIARLTRGELPGDLRGRPVGVGVLGDEDSFDDVWTPRLHAAGADLTRVVQIERPDGGFVNIREDRESSAPYATSTVSASSSSISYSTTSELAPTIGARKRFVMRCNRCGHSPARSTSPCSDVCTPTSARTASGN